MATESITDYIHFCIDNIVPKKQVTHFPNNKPYITKQVKSSLNKKKLAFKNKDRVGASIAQKEINRLLKEAREKHRRDLEETSNS